MKREILTYPNPVLTQVSEWVRATATGIPELVADMLETMHAAGGVGLAAIQVGVPLRVFVMAVDGKEWALINPVVKGFVGDIKDTREGCLSLPNVFEWVPRYPGVIIEYSDLGGGIRITRTFTGLEGHCAQHEIEHHEGMLFPDKLHPNKRNRVLAKFLKGVK